MKRVIGGVLSRLKTLPRPLLLLVRRSHPCTPLEQMSAYAEDLMTELAIMEHVRRSTSGDGVIFAEAAVLSPSGTFLG